MEISNSAKKALLILARKSLELKILGQSTLQDNASFFPELKNIAGAFVTLNYQNNLRGCIGQLEGRMPLIDLIPEMALSAAFKDSRFNPVTAQELSLIKIEISVLTPPQKALLEDIIPNQHGVILSCGYQSSTFLPQVWEQLPQKELFLSALCQKGGMNKNCYQDPKTTIQTYQCIVFNEDQLKDFQLEDSQ